MQLQLIIILSDIQEKPEYKENPPAPILYQVALGLGYLELPQGIVWKCFLMFLSICPPDQKCRRTRLHLMFHSLFLFFFFIFFLFDVLSAIDWLVDWLFKINSDCCWLLNWLTDSISHSSSIYFVCLLNHSTTHFIILYLII